MNLDISVLRGLLTLIIFVAFVGIWVWAWSSKRKETFDASAALPLEDDDIASDHIGSHHIESHNKETLR